VTSNVGAQESARFGSDRAAIEATVRDAAATFFRPELLNRLDAQVAFSSLTPEALARLVRREFRLVR